MVSFELKVCYFHKLRSANYSRIFRSFNEPI